MNPKYFYSLATRPHVQYHLSCLPTIADPRVPRQAPLAIDLPSLLNTSFLLGLERKGTSSKPSSAGLLSSPSSVFFFLLEGTSVPSLLSSF